MIPHVLLNNLWYLVRGAAVTVELASACIALSGLLGLVIALLRVFGNLPVRAVFEVYLYVIRGVPLLILLFTMYYVLPYVGVNLPATVGGVLVITLYYGAFTSEVFRAAILALPRGQWDAARSLGMRPTLMLQLVIFPQAFRMAAPPFVNTCMMIIKDTSLVSIIGLWELTLAGREVVERTFAAFQMFAGVAMIYFVVCYSLACYGRYLEERFRYGH